MNCKPGDMAKIIYSELPENIGAVVEVLRPYDPHPYTRNFRWVVRPAYPMRAFIDSAGDMTTTTALFGEAAIEDVHLRLLRPFEEPETTTTEKELTA